MAPMRALVLCLACWLTVLVAPPATAQEGRLAVEYTVKVADIPGQLFHVTTDIRNINQPAIELSLPVWSPGWYVIENYAKNIFRYARLRIRRGGEERELETAVGFVELVNYRFVDSKSPTPEQLKVRESWLKR